MRTMCNGDKSHIQRDYSRSFSPLHCIGAPWNDLIFSTLDRGASYRSSPRREMQRNGHGNRKRGMRILFESSVSPRRCDVRNIQHLDETKAPPHAGYRLIHGLTSSCRNRSLGDPKTTKDTPRRDSSDSSSLLLQHVVKTEQLSFV